MCPHSAAAQRSQPFFRKKKQSNEDKAIKGKKRKGRKERGGFLAKEIVRGDFLFVPQVFFVFAEIGR